jgi:hypothetical protein
MDGTMGFRKVESAAGKVERSAKGGQQCDLGKEEGKDEQLSWKSKAVRKRLAQLFWMRGE